jgi:hypothetical protein
MPATDDDQIRIPTTATFASAAWKEDTEDDRIEPIPSPEVISGVTGVELIAAALAAGAAAASQDVARAAVTQAYDSLRKAIRSRLAGRPKAQEVLESVEDEPGHWEASLGSDLTASGADQDQAILAAAVQLLTLTHPDQVQAGLYRVDETGNTSIQIENAFGPTAGTMNGPVTVSYGQLPDPPAKPGAK